jgi:hypothetical protein
VLYLDCACCAGEIEALPISNVASKAATVPTVMSDRMFPPREPSFPKDAPNFAAEIAPSMAVH